MELQEKLTDKESLLNQIVEEIEKRRNQIDTLNAELGQLEAQGFSVQGAILVLKELIEESSEETEIEVK